MNLFIWIIDIIYHGTDKIAKENALKIINMYPDSFAEIYKYIQDSCVEEEIPHMETTNIDDFKKALLCYERHITHTTKQYDE